jgi:hypothetical protein
VFAVTVSTASSSSSSSSNLAPEVSLHNVSTSCLTPVCRLLWLTSALAALHPPPLPPASDLRSYFLGDQNGIVITTSKCFILAVHKGGGGDCRVKMQRLTACDASVITAGSTVSAGQMSDDGDGSAVLVPPHAGVSQPAAAAADASGAAAAADASGVAAAALSGRLFKRSCNVLGRVTWTLQLVNVSGGCLSYTNKEGKDKVYDLTGCTVTAPQVRSLFTTKP